MEPLVELRGVGLTYHAPAGETQALADVSFAVEPGEFISIVGPSGCGKSTLLSLIAGMLRPTQGRVVLRDIWSGGSWQIVMYARPHV